MVGHVSNRPFRAGQFSSGRQMAGVSNYNSTAEGDLIWADLAPIALLSFQASGQAALSRALAINELPTIVLSTVYYDLMAELTEILPHKEGSSFWEKSKRELLENEKRNRRSGAIVGLFLGGLVGGFLFRSSVGMDGALWLAGGIKLGVVVSWLIWPAETI